METLLKQIITSPDLLRQGDILLTQTLQIPENRRALLDLLAANENRNYLTLIQNVYPTLWESLDPGEQEFTRQYLLKMFYEKYKSERDIEALGLFINKLHNIEGYEKWAGLYQQLIGVGLSEQILEFFLVIYRSQDDRVSIINKPLMQQLIPSIQSSTNTPVLTEKLAILLYYIIKTSASLEGTNDELFTAILGPHSSWLSTLYLNILSSPSLYLHKLILQQLTVLFSTAPKFSFQAFSTLINFLWKYFNNLLPIYLNQNVINEGQEKPRSVSDEYIFGARYDEEVTVSQGLVYQCLELMESIFLHKSMKKLMRFAIYPLLSVMSTLLLITKRDEKEWIESENKFIADTEDEDIIGVRNRIISFINILVEDRYKGAVDILRLIINNAFTNQSLLTLKQTLKDDIVSKGIMSQLSEKALSQPQELEQIFEQSFTDLKIDPPLIKQASTLLLFSFTSHILSSVESKNSLFEKLRVEVEGSSYPLLRIQALNTLVKCAESINVEQIPNFLVYSLNSLGSQFVGLQVISVKAIGVFCRKIRLSPVDHSRVRIEEGSIQKIVGLVKVFARETVHVFLDTLIELIKFSLETKELVVRYVEELVSDLLELGLADGLVSSQLIELFGEASSMRIQEFFLVKLQQALHTKGSEEAVQLLSKILETNIQNQIFTCNNTEHLNTLISQSVTNPRMQSLIRSLLNSATISQETLDTCVANMKPSWFIPLHQRGITFDISPLLKQSILSVIELTSPSEVEQQLTLPFYLMWNSYDMVIDAIKSFGLYHEFVTKWLRYQETFKGSVLKKVSLALASQLLQEQYRKQVDAYIEKEKNNFLKEKEALLKIEPDWEDEEEEEGEEGGEEDWDGLGMDEDGWMDGDLVNKIVEKQLIGAIKGIESVCIEEIIAKRSK